MPIAQSLLESLVIGTYPAEEDDLVAAERAYCEMEDALQDELDRYGEIHPGYDEVQVEQMEIWHDPYVLLALIVTALMWVVWNKTAFGKNMFAVGSNEEAARVSGVNVMMTIIGVFMVAGALYGYTGFIEAARMGSSTATLGLNYEADAISAAVIGGVSFVGGTGRISGVVLGVFMMQLIIAGMTFLGISGNVTYIVKGAVILFAVILDMRKYMTRK